MNNLDEIEDITNSLVFENIPSYFDNIENVIEFIETSLCLMDEYTNNDPTIALESDFEEIILEDILELLYEQFDNLMEYDKNEMELLLEEALQIFMNSFYPSQNTTNDNNTNDNNTNDNNTNDNNTNDNNTNDNNTNDDTTTDDTTTNDTTHKNNDIIRDKIIKLKGKPQPTQRTKEWYEFRHNLITASNAYKAFESQCTVNQLIYEKCKPLNINNDPEEYKVVNTYTTLHWGQKYEPLSVMFYEYLYNTKVEDFGCIQHEYYKFLGASPDGINIDENSDKYGKMLEIKNIVNREINGIPKKEYWVQMQLQMEVCDLEECDFLETKFIEYSDSESYYSDTLTPTDKKGTIIHFLTPDGKPYYVYKPLTLTNNEDIIVWEEKNIELYQSDKYNYVFIKYIYWKLEILSCVLVLRNKTWFENNIKSIAQVWKIIENERVTGYEHRAPKKRAKLTTKKQKNDTYDLFNTGECLIPINIC